MEPGDLHQAVQTAFNNRDVEALVALYQSDAWLFGPTGPVQGAAAIRDAWTDMLALAEHTEMVTLYAIEQGDIALLSNRWTATSQDGEVSAVSAEVARRQSDGTWKYVIDNPDAAGVLSA
jgi:ketosteroid isomerase-like protein